MAILPKGTVLGGFRLLGALGAGNMGQVYLAKQLSMDRVVAIKVLNPRLAKKSPTFGEMFIREARGIACLNHPCIVAVHDSGAAVTDRGTMHWFAMEYVDGESLDDVLEREGTLDETELQRVLSSVASALAYAARKGFVHRDVKPGNIMMTRSGQVKLTDFGLVIESGRSGNRRVVGTPSYMSPEQARGLEVDHRSDQYSLGCTLFHMLTGEPPYQAPSTQDVLTMHKRSPVPDPGEWVECTVAMRALCMRLMAKEPGDRFADPEQLIAAIRELRPLVARDEPAQVNRQRKPVARRPRARAARPRPPARRRPASSTAAPRHPGGRRTAAVASTRRPLAPGSTAAISAIASQELHAEGDSQASRPRRRRLAPALLWLPRQVGRGLGQLAWLLIWIITAVFQVLWIVVSWVLDRLVAMLPVIRDFLYWLVPHLARLVFLPSAATWRIRIHGGHNHLVEAQDSEDGYLAVFYDGRHLPFVWSMTHARFDACKALASRSWLRDWLVHQMERLTATFARDPQQRAQALVRRLDRVRGRRRGGITMSFDRRRRGRCDEDLIAFARTAQVRLLPVACAARPAGIFRRSPQRMMIPAPFASIHLVIGTPIDVGPNTSPERLRDLLETDMVDLQDYCDRIARLDSQDSLQPD